MLTDQDKFIIATLIYEKYSQAYGILQKIKKETNDGSKDWEDFHEERLERAEKEFIKWNEMLMRARSEYREILNKM